MSIVDETAPVQEAFAFSLLPAGSVDSYFPSSALASPPAHHPHSTRTERDHSSAAQEERPTKIVRARGAAERNEISAGDDGRGRGSAMPGIKSIVTPGGLQPASSPQEGRQAWPAGPSIRDFLLFTSSSHFQPSSNALTEDELFPFLKGLSFKHYRPYLLDRPAEPAYSTAFFESFLRFLGTAVPYTTWSTNVDRLLHRHNAPLPQLVRQIGMRQPNKDYIRRVFTLRKSDAAIPTSFGFKLHSKLEAMGKVLRWVYNDENVGLPEVVDLIQRAPKPLHILIRDLASTARFADLVFAAEQELHSYLVSRSRSSLSPEAQATRKLLTWFNERERNHDKRVYRFFCFEDGSLRMGTNGRGDPWDWVFDAERAGQGVDAAKLDEWEDVTVDETRSRRR